MLVVGEASYQRCARNFFIRGTIKTDKSLARLGAKTTAIDASSSNISIAAMHAGQDPALRAHDESMLSYRHATAEQLVDEGKQFDLVCSMEVLEHVENPSAFLRSCAALVKVLIPFSIISM